MWQTLSWHSVLASCIYVFCRDQMDLICHDWTYKVLALLQDECKIEGSLLWKAGDHDLLCTTPLIRLPSTFLLWPLWSSLRSYVLDCCPRRMTPLHLKFPHLCKSLCRLMQHFMQIQVFFPLRFKALKSRWVLTLPTNIQMGSHQLAHNHRTQPCTSGRKSKGEKIQNSKTMFVC